MTHTGTLQGAAAVCVFVCVGGYYHLLWHFTMTPHPFLSQPFLFLENSKLHNVRSRRKMVVSHEGTYATWLIKVMFINVKCTIFFQSPKRFRHPIKSYIWPMVWSQLYCRNTSASEEVSATGTAAAATCCCHCQQLQQQQRRCIRTAAEQTKKMVCLRLTSPLRAPLQFSTLSGSPTFWVNNFFEGTYQTQVSERWCLWRKQPSS